MPTEDGFRIAVPLGPKSEWARNVLAAGHCRMQLHDTVHDLDEPVLLAAGELPEFAAPAAWILDRLGVPVPPAAALRLAIGHPREVAAEPRDPSRSGATRGAGTA